MRSGSPKGGVKGNTAGVDHEVADDVWDLLERAVGWGGESVVDEEDDGRGRQELLGELGGVVGVGGGVVLIEQEQDGGGGGVCLAVA